MFLELDKPLIDYIRLTSNRESDVGGDWFRHVIDLCREERVIPRDFQFLQYKGMQYDDAGGGSVQAGAWEQNGHDFEVIQASGNASQVAAVWLLYNLARWKVKCTRIDIQATVEAGDWSQWELLERLKELGRNVSFVSSVDKDTKLELATVYIGSRYSERVTRIYEKLTAGGEKLLRFEVEYKGKRANRVAQMLAKNPSKIADYLLGEIQMQKDEALEVMFSSATTGATPDRGRFLKAKSDEAKLGEWLLTSVLPAFARYAHGHNAKTEVIAEFQKVIDYVVKVDTDHNGL